VILISGHDPDELAELVPDTGAAGCIAKQRLDAHAIVDLITR
jgi:hypothetical protein